MESPSTPKPDSLLRIEEFHNIWLYAKQQNERAGGYDGRLKSKFNKANDKMDHLLTLYNDELLANTVSVELTEPDGQPA